MKILILGFYGVGKTTALKDYPNAVDLTDVLDRSYDEHPSLERFYQYWNDDKYEIVMADPWWTDVIIKTGIPFYTVIPDVDRKDEFFENYRNRFSLGLGGGDDQFCDYVRDCWSGWLDFYKYKLPCIECIILKKNEWMKDALDYIIKIESKKMRIVFYIHHLAFGGAERVTTVIANELVKRGHNVDIIYCVNFKNGYPLNKKINLHYVPMRVLPLRKKIKELKPDVCISILPHNSFRLMKALIGLHIPQVMCDHQNVQYNTSKSGKFIRRYIYRFADAVTVLTKNDQKHIDKWCHNTVVMYNPLSFPRLQQNMGISKTVLCVGRLNAYKMAKGFDRIIKIWGKIAHKYPEWMLIIAGSGEQEDFEYYNNLINEEHVEDSAKLIGFKPNIQDWMATSSIFALPSREEGFPCVLTEAMSQKCACVAFEIHGNINEILTDGYDGYVVKDGDLDAFQEKLELLMDNEEERKRIADNAYESVLRFSPEKIADQWEEMLLNLVKK